ncbi:MAG: hypothetical protein ACYS8X_07845 [Planctomycetota bacterium]|jgi:hypothetical protein
MSKRIEYTAAIERFSATWWWGKLRNAFWVSFITLLIWVYADLEISETRDFAAIVRLTVGPASKTVLLSPRDVSVDFTAKGSRRSLAEFERWLDENDAVIEIDLSDYAPREYKVRTEELLSGAPDVDRHGVVVQRASPDPIEFRLDELLTREAAVQFDYVNGVAEQVQIEPSAVTVTAAKSVWQRIEQAIESPAITTVREDLSQIEPGKATTITSQLVASIAGESVQLDVKAVSVTLTVSQRTISKAVTVPVRLLEPPDWPADTTWQEYSLQRKDPLAWRVELTVTGARKDLERLRAEDMQVYVVLTDDDKRPVESWLDRPVQIRFPAGLQVQLVGEPPHVQFKLVKRSELAPAP